VKFLSIVLGAEASERMVMIMNGMWEKRHRIIYEEMDIVTENEAKQAINWTEEFVSIIADTIRQTNPSDR
jgi:uncharacterized protein (UPF0332 family)